jgi:putative ABC transport system ATP-binding protein
VLDLLIYPVTFSGWKARESAIAIPWCDHGSHTSEHEMRVLRAAVQDLRRIRLRENAMRGAQFAPYIFVGTVLRVEQVTKTYRMGEVTVPALRGIDLGLERGALAVLLGASGSGKSTLLNILGGLDVPTTGRIVYGNRDLTDASERSLTAYRRDHVGFVFQFYNLVPSLTARENVALVTDIADDPLTPEKALELVGLSHRLDHYPAQMSGGEQQRVAIARAIAKRPDVLLCDEPTGALDVETGKKVLAAIEHVNRELGATTAVITHNAAIAAMADRVLKLADGKLVADERNAARAAPDTLEW